MRIASDARLLVVILLGGLLLAGCSALSRRTSETGESTAMADGRMVLRALADRNQDLNNFKGLGNIEIRRNQKKIVDERIAWIGSQTDRLSIAVLISGQPAVKMASDGKWFYYYEARQGESIYKKEPAAEATLQRVVSIPIRISDIVQLLAGRPPLRDHHSALLQDSGTGYVLILKKWWGDVVENIFLNEDRTQVRQIEFFDRRGKLDYRARFDEMQIVGGYQVPARLSISNGEGIVFKLEIQRYLTDVSVSPSMFVLHPPE